MKTVKKTIKLTVGFALGALLLWLVFRGTDWAEVWRAIREVSILPLLMIQVFTFLSLLTRVKRLGYIVRAVTPATDGMLFSTINIGNLANFTLPGRAGEAIRALVLTRLTGVPFFKSLALVALDRVTDLFGLLAVIVVAMLAYTPPETVTIPAETFNMSAPYTFHSAALYKAEIFMFVVSLGFLATVVTLYVSKAFALRVCRAVVGVASRSLAEKLCGFLEHFADGLHIFRSLGDMAKSLAYSLLTWFFFLLILLCAILAFDIEAPWYTVVIMQVMVAVAISAPGMPGFVGQFHLPIVVCLMMLVPGMSANDAKALAIVSHLSTLLPVLLFGFYCLFREKLGLLQLSRETESD